MTGRLVRLFLLICIGVLAAPTAHAQSGAIRIIFPYAAGGSGDATARLLADKLQTSLGQTVLVENRTGGAGRIGVNAVKNAAADGGTLLFTPFAAVTIYPFAYRSLDYDPFTDLAPITQVCTFDFALAVRSHFPAKTPQELVAWLKANPDKAQYGSPGAGALPHFFGLLFGRAAGVDMTHIAYKGTAPALSDLLGGQIPMVSSTVSDFLELHRADKISRHRHLGRGAHDGSAGCADVQGKRDRHCWQRLVRDVCSRAHASRCDCASQCGSCCRACAAGYQATGQRFRPQADRNIAGATRRDSESRRG